MADNLNREFNKQDFINLIEEEGYYEDSPGWYMKEVGPNQRINILFSAERLRFEAPHIVIIIRLKGKFNYQNIAFFFKEIVDIIIEASKTPKITETNSYGLSRFVSKDEAYKNPELFFESVDGRAIVLSKNEGCKKAYLFDDSKNITTVYTS